MMRDRHNIPEGTKDLSAKYKRNVEKHKHCSICLSTEELAKKTYCRKFCSGMPIWTKGKQNLQHTDALQNANINIMLLFWKKLGRVLIVNRHRKIIT